MLIYLIRHARPEGMDGSCYGRSDVRADDEETRRVARSLRGNLPADVLETAAIHSSPLTRCWSLARELVPARPVVIASELLELDFGSWEGSAWSDVPRAELDAWARDPWGYAPGGGESAQAVLSRFQAWATRVRDEGHAVVVAVTHAGVIRVALSVDSADPIGLSLSIPYGSVHLLVIEGSRSDAREMRRTFA